MTVKELLNNGNMDDIETALNLLNVENYIKYYRGFGIKGLKFKDEFCKYFEIISSHHCIYEPEELVISCQNTGPNTLIIYEYKNKK